MTKAAGDTVHNQMPEFDDGADVAEYLRTYAYRQFTVGTHAAPDAVRRLIIGKVTRFPELAKVFYEGVPKRAMAALATTFERLVERGLLAIDDPMAAASQFNWLIVSGPFPPGHAVGRSKASRIRRHAAEGAPVFLAAYGKR